MEAFSFDEIQARSAPSTDRILDAASGQDETRVDFALRPQSLEDFIGQSSIKENLHVFLESARRRQVPCEHTIFHGPPGLGKTSLAHVIAREMNATIRVTSGPALEKAGDLAAILTSLDQGDILFIDEIHRINRSIEEVLYSAMEDFAMDIIVGQGPTARTVRLDVKPFTLIGATTRLSLLGNPLRDRFGAQFHLDFYTFEEITDIIKRSAGLLGIEADQTSLEQIATRSRRTPRIANRLLRRVRDYALVRGTGEITPQLTAIALERLHIDEYGLDVADRRILQTLIERYHGGPAGLAALAASAAEDAATLEEVIEPYLLQEGLVIRTQRGRIATAKAYKHLGLTPPSEQGILLAA